jgi:HD-like signal output (HDOD) protein
MNERERVAHVLREIKTLPTLPIVAIRLLEMGEDPNTSIQAIARLVEADVSLTTRILKLVNSSFFGVRREVTSIHHAIMILGTAQLRSLVLSSAVVDLFDKNGSVGKFSRGEFWKHCLAVSGTARTLAVKTHLVDPEVAFTAGLIHDMGKIVIDRYLHQEFIKILEVMEEPGMTMRTAEYTVLGVCHAMIGQHVAIYWNLPEILREAVGHHHKPHNAPTYPQFAALIAIADHMARELKIGDGGGADSPLDPCVLGLSGLSPADYEEVKAKLAETLDEQIAVLDGINETRAVPHHAH